ncbi:MAG: DUF1294 domain-containing protein [Bacteroidetes bacterium]|nr:DUF1294 domain-containing protein [Bacteroidota bacterium]
MLLKACTSLMFGMSLFAYVLMWYDKHQAIRRKPRISESTLWWFAILFGATGIFLGTKWPLFHKAAKQTFRILVPLLVLLQFSWVIYLAFFN